MLQDPPVRLRFASVIASLTSGGIGPVCRYAAEELAGLTDWHVTLLSLHDPKGNLVDERSGLRIISLGLGGNCARPFLEWLTANPQDLLVTSEVSWAEPAYRFLPRDTRHVIQIHDSGRRYRAVAVRHAAWVDGVICVGRHIEERLRQDLGKVAFQGLIRTVHNGADFPPAPVRKANQGPLRLLFMGGVTAFKGVFDIPPLLQQLSLWGVPVTLNIVGGDNAALRRQLERKGLAKLVTWSGRVAHERCYQMAADSDVFLMTSRKEPFGMVTIEAMSMGCVPIAYDTPSGSREIIEHEKSGVLVPLGDLRAWAEAIRRLHHDRGWLMELSAAAMQRARTGFNAETMARNFLAFLTHVRAHAQSHPARREIGMPPELPEGYVPPRCGYQRLPEWLRERIRNRIGASPRLCYWLLNR
jgi:glycosyltransferase involved in cell wall biosynthesis